MSEVPVWRPLRLHSVSPYRTKKTCCAAMLPSSRQTVRALGSRSERALERITDECARLGLDALQVICSAEALRVELIDILRPGRPRREPAIRSEHLEPTNRGPIAGRIDEHLLDGIAGELRCADVGGGQLQQRCLLLLGGRRVDTLEGRGAELLRELLIQLGRITTCAGRDLGREQVEHDAILVRGPHLPVVPQERAARTLLATEAERAIEQSRHEPVE